MNYLRDIAVFVRVVQLKGFASAGRDLGLTAPSVSKQIARLEAELGVSLLHRTTHNLFLTDAGREFYEHCVRGLSEIELARATALSFNDELRGKLRVHATLSVGQALIAPALIEFMAQNRNVHIDFEMGSVPINPMEHQVDIAIRTKTSREESPGHVNIGRRVLGRVRQMVVASPEYLSRAGVPAAFAELPGRACLVYVTQSTSSENWPFHTGRQDVVIRVEPVLRSNNWYAIRTAALRGLGIARLPDFTVREEIASGRLVSLFASEVRSDQQILALFPKSPRMPAKMRLLLDFLAARLSTGAEGGAVPAAVEPVPADGDAKPHTSVARTSKPAGRAARPGPGAV